MMEWHFFGLIIKTNVAYVEDKRLSFLLSIFLQHK